LTPGDDKIAAERLYSALSKPPKVDSAAAPPQGPANVAGRWDAVIEYRRGQAHHVLMFEQKEDALSGTHQGEIVAGDLRGRVAGADVDFSANHQIEGTSLHFDFRGKLESRPHGRDCRPWRVWQRYIHGAASPVQAKPG
jgi:L-seryl-tRNA(Ser) seleniumtransferase